MTFLIFDPHNDLIFLNLDTSFQQFLLDSNLISVNQNDDLDAETALRFSMTLLLGPFVSTKRHLFAQESIHFDSIPNASIAFKNCNQFVFIYLCRSQTNSVQSDAHLHEVFLERKLSMFAQLTMFTFGNALYNISKHTRELKMLLEMIHKWQELNQELTFVIDSLEHLKIGEHLLAQMGSDMHHVQQMIRLHTQVHNQERYSCLLVMFHDKLLYKHHATNTSLRQEDIISLFLLSQIDSVHSDSVTESDETRADLSGAIVFLLSHTHSISVPHIYRKILITDELYMVVITEVTSPICSILLLSLSTMIESFTSLKNELNDQSNFNARRWTESLTRIVDNFQRFLGRNFASSHTSEPLNLGSMKQLTELTKNVESNFLAREQIDRILTMLITTLFHYYEKLAFSQLHTELLPDCLKAFEQLSISMTQYLRENFRSSLNFIRVKYGTQQTSIGTLICQNLDLVAFLRIDRKQNHFLFGITPEMSSQRVLELIFKTYRHFARSRDPRFVVFSDDTFRCVYLHDSTLHKNSKISIKTSKSCELLRILSSSDVRPLISSSSSAAISYQSNGVSCSSSQVELFAITKTANESYVELSYMEIINLAKLVTQHVEE